MPKLVNIGGKSLVDCIYPVGSIYISIASTDPSSLFGGTWERIKGYVLAGINENDDDENDKTSFNQKAGTVIGSKYLHSHRHDLGDSAGETSGGHAWGWGASGRTVYAASAASAGNGNNNYINTKQGVWNRTTYSGSGDAQNIQPTLLVYIWKRTA